MNHLLDSNRLSRLAVRGAACVMLAAGLVPCGCDKGDNTPKTVTPAPIGTPGTNPPPPGTPETTSADARILSILHLKNEEEVDLGKLAKDRGSSDAVKTYGQMLIDDHSSADDKVEKTAKDANIKLMDDDEVKRMLAREKGMPAPPTSAYDDLKKLEGAAFDAAFIRHMETAHADLIRTVESAQTGASDQRVRDLLTEVLVSLRKHRDHAKTLPGAPAPTPPR